MGKNRKMSGLKPHVCKRVGAFLFNFFYKQGRPEQCFLRISNEDGMFEIRIAGTTDTYGYLLTAAMQDRIDQLEGYAVLVSVPILGLTCEQEFASEVGAAVNNYISRRMEKGAEDAAKVTDEEEMGSQVVMEEASELASNKQ